jgi:hypothetical protein
MYAAKVIDPAIAPTAAAPAISEQIRAFLDGETNGEALLHALYDHILEEPIPPAMLAILQK